MNVTRVRVRRERPTAVAVAIALLVTMLVVYVLTLDLGGPDVVQSVAAAPRVTREIEFEALEGWCVAMARCDSQQEARLQASAYVDRGAAGVVAELDGAWRVLGAVYDSEKEAARIAKRLKDDEGIPAEVTPVRAEALTLRITAPEAQIDAIAGADALLRSQTGQLGQVALQLDRGDILPDAARALCALAATEAADAAKGLSAIPGAGENGLCAGLIGRLEDLSEMLSTISANKAATGAGLSGMLRCAQIENFLGQWEMMEGIRD